jgi:hypothetical protein
MELVPADWPVPPGVQIREETPAPTLDLLTLTVADDAAEGGCGAIARVPDRVIGFFSADSTVKVVGSANPTGPRLHDLLELLEMNRFGVLGWYIFEREGEIFDYDCRDEDKVMACLWARWIFLHRSIFFPYARLDTVTNVPEGPTSSVITAWA